MKDKVTNRVDVLGYLRENNLELKTTPKGRVIQGSMNIAFDNLNGIRINVYAQEKSAAKGTENKTFTALSTLLPNYTTSIKSQLEANPSATFDTVKDVVTKISAHCEFREYATRDERGAETSRTQVSLLNWFDSIHVADPTKPFEPEAKFSVDLYIENLVPERKPAAPGELAEETGRYILTGLVPDFKGMMQRIVFVTEAGEKSQYISTHWNKGETAVAVTGGVVNLRKVEQKAGVQAGFGQPAMGSTVTTFIEERIIRGGPYNTIDANLMGMEKAGFTSEEVKNGLMLRETAINENSEKRQNKGTVNTPPQATKDFGFGAVGTATPSATAAFDPKGF